MNIVNIILAVTCIILAITQIVHAKWIGQLMADNEVHKSALSTCGKRLDAQNDAIKELTGWNTDQDASIHNILDTIIGIDTEAQNITKNLMQTDNRVTEIERYYVTYVARKKEPENDETDNSESSV
jgi:peptidoglycan hydrolase CwlO-like protein